MNKFIKEQLKKAKVLLPEYDENTTEIFIKKSEGISSNDLAIGHCYIFYLEDYIINEPDNFTLSSNWNNNTKPKENKVYGRVLQIMGKMLRLYTRSVDSGYIWEGWVPQKGASIIEEIDSSVQI